MIQIFTWSIKELAVKFTKILLNEFNQSKSTKEYVNLALCWWRSVEYFYKQLSNSAIWLEIFSHVRLFPTDEKYENWKEVNYDTIGRTLNLWVFQKDNIFLKDIGNEPQYLNDILHGSSLDIAIFWVGEDWHVAWLFSEDPSMGCDIKDEYRFVLNSPKPPLERITLTSATIKKIPIIFLIFIWTEKWDAYNRFLSWEDIPASICRNAKRLYVFTNIVD